MVHRLASALVFLSSAGLMAATPSAAQEAGSLKGLVLASGKPLPSARIDVEGTHFFAVADSAGAFRIGSLAAGRHSVTAKLLGYSIITLPVEISPGKDSHIELTLTALPLPLEPVTVSASGLIIPAMAAFAERKARGNGTFFTRDDIRRMRAREFTDVLRRVPGLLMASSGGTNNSSQSVRTGRNTEGSSGARSCPVVFYMNGMPFPMGREGTINGFVTAEEIEAVEVYTGASQIPPQFNSSGNNARCGVVVIWTLNGTESRR